MLSTTWIQDKVNSCAESILGRLKSAGTLTGTPAPFVNYEFTGKNFRRAHLSIIDKLETNKIWLMHLCVFPHVDDTSPIFGFDIIAGPNRLSGAFHDFSMPAVTNHPMNQLFNARTIMLQWKKPRELPEWAKMIFSDDIIAIGAVDQPEEVDQLINLALSNLDFYLRWIGSDRTPEVDTVPTQNMYCHYQKQNPHNVRSLVALGLNEEEATHFVEEVMFPEIKSN